MTPRRQVMVVAAMLAIAGLVDFVTRVHVARQPSTRELGAETQGLPAPPLPLALARQRLQSWLPSPEPRDAAGDAEAGPGAAATSVPDRAAIGGLHFVLRGVFDAGPPFAVFDVVSGSGGAAEQHRLSVGEEIKGVRVERIAGRSVRLSDGDNIVQLALFIDPGRNGAASKKNDE